MTDQEMTPAGESQAWRLRPVILAAIGAIAAILAQQLTDPDRPGNILPDYIAAWRIALAIGIGAGTLALSFGMERTRLAWSVAFAVLVGAVTGFVYYWSGGGPSRWFGDWRYASLLLSVAIALPLFQTARDQGGLRFPYAQVHGHAWTNVMLWFASWAFIGIAFLLAWLLSALFDLIGLHFVREMLERHWFSAALAGAAFGGALGLLRERDRVVRLLQRVVTAVLAVLAPVLGIGLLLFLASLPFTGLGALWEATKSTTPILLSCVIGALILANAVIGNGEDEEATNPVLRWGAMALGLAVLPLCVIAAIATGMRIDQYGFTPDRLWALVFVILATAYGVAYFESLVLGRRAWAARVRPANLRMAFGVSAIALFLATPILSFNAISTADQVARLDSGRIKPDTFDWAALEFDLGDPGKAAVRRLTGSKDAAIRKFAVEASKSPDRWHLSDIAETVHAADTLNARVRIVPEGAALPPALRGPLLDEQLCGTGDSRCTVFLDPNGVEALVFDTSCFETLSTSSVDTESSSAVYSAQYDCVDPKHLKLSGGKWVGDASDSAIARDKASREAIAKDYAAGKVEVRTVPRRQVFVGGVPVGNPFE